MATRLAGVAKSILADAVGAFMACLTHALQLMLGMPSFIFCIASDRRCCSCVFQSSNLSVRCC
jgi:hypothetical protein